MEAFVAVAAKLGKELPPTCKQATRFDTAIMSPVLTELLCEATALLDNYSFDAHAPLILEFAIPPQLPQLHRWALPKPWTDFALSPAAFEHAYHVRSVSVDEALQTINTQEDLAGAFQIWAGVFADSVSDVLEMQRCKGTYSAGTSKVPPRTLPDGQKGRKAGFPAKASQERGFPAHR